MVTLRNEADGPDDIRRLWAELDSEGNLQLHGEDIGPKTAIVSSTGEYEWFETVQKTDLPKLIALLGGKPNDHILDVLEKNWTGPRAGKFETLLHESDIDVVISVWPLGPHTRS